VNLMYYTLHIYKSNYEQRSNKRNGSKIKAYSETHADCIRKGGAVIAFMCNKKRKPMEEITDNTPVKSKRKRIVEDEGVTPRKFKKVSMLSCHEEIKAAEIVFKEKYEKIEENLEKKSMRTKESSWKLNMKRNMRTKENS
jgi:hypothetical protein